MSIFPFDPFCVGPLHAKGGRLTSGPSDKRHAAFWLELRHSGEPLFRRVVDAAGTSVESSRNELMTEIAARLQRRTRIPGVIISGLLAFIAALYANAWLAMAVAMAMLVLVLVLAAADTARRTTFVLYSLDEEVAAAYEGVVNGVAWIERSLKRASPRGLVNVTRAATPITTNVPVPEISLGAVRFQFFPDGTLVLYGMKVWFVPYAQMRVEASRSRHVQYTGIPEPDSVRVGQQWQFQRKDGSPDKRHRHNPLLPVVESGRLIISVPGIIDETISLSNPLAAEHFRNAIVTMTAKPVVKQSEPQRPPPPRPAAPVTVASTALPTHRPSPRSSPESDDLVPAVIRAETTMNLPPAKEGTKPRAAIPPAASWIAPSSRITVHGFELSGFVYVGSVLRGLDVALAEPALIDPSKPIESFRTAAASERETGYYPSYDRLTPSVRAVYLNWLANGRNDPQVPIGVVFLFFYGLERRVFELLGTKASDAAECVAIAREVERLMSIYDHEAFGWYASSLLDLLSTREPELISPARGDRSRPGDDLPFRTRVALAKLAAAGAALPADLALEWFRGSRGPLRTPAERCPAELEKLFGIRYSEKFGTGIRLRANKTPLKVRHTPASSALRERSVTIEHLPEVTAATRPLAEIEKIVDRCCDELDAYSRWIAKNPRSELSLAAVSLLPVELASNVESEEIRALSSFVTGRMGGDDHVVIPSDEILFYWPVANPLKVARSEGVQLTQALDRIGFSIEPDVRFGGPTPASGGSIVVFRRSADAPAAASPDYRAALVLARLGVTVANADGVFTAAEKEALRCSLGDAFDLAASERRRLKAHVEWLLAAQLGMAGLKRQLATLATEQRQRIAAYVARIAVADGTVDTAEMRALEKLYKSLGLTTDDLYRNVHSVMTDEAHAPAAPQNRQRGVVLDMARVQNKLAETAAVSSLLATVFADDEEAPPPPPVTPQIPAAVSVGPLDASATAFLRVLVRRGEWPRLDVESLASEHALLVDGALEAINDYAFDRCGDPVWEGDDPIIINEHIAKEILS